MKKVFAMAVTLALCACQTPVPEQERTISVEGPKYLLNVARIDVVDDFPAAYHSRTELKPGNDASLAKVMHDWVGTRLVARGADKSMEVRITQAAITKKDLPKQKTGLEGLFTKEQTEEYNGQLAVELKIYSPERTLPVAHAEIAAELTRTLREDATLEDRKALYHNMVADIMHEMDGSLDRNIHNYLGSYLQ